jgi:glucose/arabinose dehydrogenase
MRAAIKARLFRRAALALTAALACVPAARAQQHSPLPDPIPGVIRPSPVGVSLQAVMTGLVSPVAAATAPGDPAHRFVVDQVGQVWRLPLPDGRAGPAANPELFLDVRTLLVPLGIPPSFYDERGLLGLAFHPDFQANGLFYTFTSQPVNGRADFSTQPQGVAPNCQSVITEWRLDTAGKPGGGVDLSSARELMRIDKPQSNHNGGTLVFGPDRMLYVSLGDGGSGNDQGPGHAPEGNGQSLAPGNVLGKILRIDPLGRDSANGKYGIPADNPFAGGPSAREIYAYGFRNPYRMAFDSSGFLFAGDVGQNNIEELDAVGAGKNYGWPIKEGSFLFDRNGFVVAASPGSPAGLADPFAQYDHSDGMGTTDVREAIVAGYLYRGAAVPGLAGRYVFADYAGPRPALGHMFVLGPSNEVQELVAANRNPLALAVLGFGQDQQSELYLLANGTGTVSGMTGVVLKLVPPSR